MKIILPILFATIAAIGNAIFAYAQKQSTTVHNGLLYVSVSALLACLLTLLVSPIAGPVQIGLIWHNWKMIFISGFGLFLTYLGFNLLYSRFGVSPYVLYAVISILTTTVVVGLVILKEPLNAYQRAAIVSAVITVILFSLGRKAA